MHLIWFSARPDTCEKYLVTSFLLYLFFKQAYTARLISPLSVISTSLHNLFISIIYRGFLVLLLTPAYTYVYVPALQAGLSFLFYGFFQKSLSTTTSVAKHGAMFIFYIISAQVVPALVPEPIPEVQVGSASVRAVPEVTTLAP